jgi:hypothetical protein
MRFRVEIPEGGLIPRGYGVAWCLVDRQMVLCLPLGLNVVASWLRALYRWVRFPKTAGVGVRELMRAEYNGFERGVTVGENRARWKAEHEYQRGVSDGRAALEKDIHAEIEAWRAAGNTGLPS